MAQSGNTEKLTPKQEALIAALLAGHNHQVAAKVAGVAKRTSDRWLTLPHFQQAYKDAQKAVFDTALNTLCLGVEDALASLQRHIKADVEPTASTQLQASKTWIEQSIALHKMTELESKVKELEELLKLQPGSTNYGR